jgi:PBP1b-binding outer membrane lipoprotein LpoB
MQTTVLQTEEAQNKRFAAQDARKRSNNNKQLHTQATRDKLVRMQLALQLVYNSKAVYLVYNKNSVAIKLHSAIVKDKKQLKLLEADWDKQSVTKKVSKQGVLYSFTA